MNYLRKKYSTGSLIVMLAVSAQAASLHPAQAAKVFPNTAYGGTGAPKDYVPRRGPLATH